MLRLGGILLLLALASCSHRGGVCPSLKTYSPEFRERLALEIELLSPSSALETAMLDYAELRAQVRACEQH